MRVEDRARDIRSALLRAAGLVVAGLAILRLTCAPHPPTMDNPEPAVVVSDAAPELVHDHTPHHGGVVGMIDDRHVEALALADGTLRVYVTDRWRKPLPLDRVSGSVTIGSNGNAAAIALDRKADCLEIVVASATSPTIEARIDLSIENTPLEIEFVLPIGRRSGGAVGVPLEGCVAPSRRSNGSNSQALVGARAPRCTLEFASEVSALATTADGTRLLLAAVDVGTSAWRLPEVTLDLGLDAPPPLVMTTAEAPHREAANAIVASPDSTRAVLALEGRLLLYTLADGKVLRSLGGGRGIVQDIDWSDDGKLLLVSRFYERAATVLDANDGHSVASLSVADEVAAVAFGPAGALAAVGTRDGEITMFDVASTRKLRNIRAGTRAVEALAFLRARSPNLSSRLVSASADAGLRVFDSATGALLAEIQFDSPLYRIGVAADQHTFATGDRGGRVRVHDSNGSVIETLSERRDGSSVLDLAFAGTTLFASDSRGTVAVWDLSRP